MPNFKALFKRPNKKTFCDKYFDEEYGCSEFCPRIRCDSCVFEFEEFRDLNRLRYVYDYFMSLGLMMEQHPQGLKINNTYLFSPRSYKWKRLGTKKWSRASSPEAFYLAISGELK